MTNNKRFFKTICLTKVPNYMLPQKTLHFKYQWDFMIFSSKRPLTSILCFCLL